MASFLGGRLSPTTAARYRSILDVYLLPEFGRMPVGRITHEAVKTFVDRLAADPEIAAGTVRNVYAVSAAYAERTGSRQGLGRWEEARKHLNSRHN